MAFTGQLNSNEIFSALYNMLISQEIFSDNLGKHQTLVDKARVDGGLYGDTKLFYATNVLTSSAWGNDSEAANLLNLFRPAAPNCQAITLDQFRQICLTVDNYLSKRAWGDEGAFSSFNSVMLGWMSETKKLYEGTLYNVYIGTTVSSTGSQSQTVTLSGTNDGQTIAEKVANILVELGDYSTAYNDLGYYRSYGDEAIRVIWNSKYVNKIKKVDTPTIFHRDGLVDKLDEDVMPARYFGYTPVAGTDVDSSTYKAASGKVIRSRKEVVIGSGSSAKHYFPGDQFAADTTFGSGKNVELADAYVEDGDVICKIVTKLPAFMSAFEVGTSFFNPKALTETHYLTWGYNTLAYFQDKPFITLKKA